MIYELVIPDRPKKFKPKKETNNLFYFFSKTLKLCSYGQFAPHPGANLHPLAPRSYANKLCPYAPRFYLKLSFEGKFAVLECSKW